MIGAILYASKAGGSGLSLWPTLLAAATLVGGIAAVQQIWNLIAKRRTRRALDHVLDTIADDLEAGDRKSDLKNLQDMLDTMQHQIKVDVPKQAQQIYLTQRLQSIADSIGEQYEEFEKLSVQAAAYNSGSGLEGRVYDAIETTIMPEYRRRQRQQRQIRLAVLAILILLIFPPPISPSQLLYAYLGIILAPDVYGRPAMLLSIGIAGVLIAGLIVLGLRGAWVQKLINGWKRKTWILISVLSGVIALALTFLANELESELPASVKSNDILQGQGVHFATGIPCLLATLLFGIAFSFGWHAGLMPSDRLSST